METKHLLPFRPIFCMLFSNHVSFRRKASVGVRGCRTVSADVVERGFARGTGSLGPIARGPRHPVPRVLVSALRLPAPAGKNAGGRPGSDAGFSPALAGKTHPEPRPSG